MVRTRDVAEKDGMPGVMQTPFFAERIEMNPAQPGFVARD